MKRLPPKSAATEANKTTLRSKVDLPHEEGAPIRAPVDV
jgi:hypothetical protein